MNIGIRRITCVMGLVFWCVSASAAPDANPSARPLTFSDAISRALDRNPGLRVFAYRQRALGGRRDTAALRPAPELQFELQDFGGTGSARGFDRAEATLALSQVIELGGKRDARVGVVDARQRAVAIQEKAQELDVLAAVARRFYAVAAADERLAVAKRASELARDAMTGVNRRVNAARAPRAEAARAKAALARAQLNRANAERELEIARLRLAALWNMPEPDFKKVRADLYAVGAPGDFDVLAERIQANPDFLQFTAESRIRQAELRLAQSQAHSNIRLRAGVKRLEDTGDTALIFGASVPLFSASRAQGAIAEAEARGEAVGAERRAMLLDTRARLFSLYQARAQAIETVATLQDQIIPQQEQALSEIRRGYDRGRYSYLERVTARGELIDAERALIDAAERAHRLRADIESLTAEPLPGGDGRIEFNSNIQYPESP
ncbi:TolC family protein [Salinisphaera japonica]|uniref:Transporter n=1 Tax=Salinisphaera japonica YTM-1 TaxID=1209778 RepID=A0A423PET5_9GAMM|nr:TolC family protein [Salinisphaera japonica]ROO24141.1 transporter [Salinisphaera japonica YTM-1]|tara:strand:+ start:2436 stop:3752 length:1317 start_codon:yes stop_codon:yes gene_type:complete